MPLFWLCDVTCMFLLLSSAVRPTEARREPCKGRKDPVGDRAAGCRCPGGCGDAAGNTIRPGKQVNVAFDRPVFASSAQSCRSEKEIYCHCHKNPCYYTVEADWWTKGGTVSGTNFECKSPENPPCAGVNGRHDHNWAAGCLSRPTNCFLTAEFDDFASYELDLGKAYTIPMLVFTTGQFLSKDNNERGLTRFLGLTIYIGRDACFTFPTYTQRDQIVRSYGPVNADKGLTLRVHCQQLYTGRYVKLKKDYSAFKGPDINIQFCELVIPVCPKGTYLSNPSWRQADESTNCLNCPAKCPFVCDNVRGCDDSIKSGSVGKTINVALFTDVAASIAPKDSFHVPAYAVDGAVTPDQHSRCFMSAITYDKTKLPFFRINLGEPHMVMRAAVHFADGYNRGMAGFEVRISRTLKNWQHPVQEGDVICWRRFVQPGEKTGLPPSVDRECTDCTSPDWNSCPVGQFATFALIYFRMYLQICEAEVFGYPHEYLTLMEGCSLAGDECVLEKCDPRSMACDQGKCKALPAQRCQYSSQCAYKGVCEGGECKLPVGANCKEFRNKCAADLTCSGHRCKVPPGKSCQVDMDCLEQQSATIICDYMKTCKRAVGSTCSNSDECGAGAVCKFSTCQCEPADHSKGQGTRCEPVIYNSTCTVACSGINFQCGNGACVCQQGFRLSSDFRCQVDAGHPCTSNDDCASGLRCNLTDAKCFITHGNKCTYTSECETGNVCDTLGFHVCRFPAGTACRNDEDCITGTGCFSTCKLIGGRQCVQNEQDDPCQPGFKCGFPFDALASELQTFCVIKKGESCRQNEPNINCEQGTVCQQSKGNSTFMCVLDVGQPCVAPEPCRIHAECRDSKCFWELGFKCFQPDSCGTGRLCDHDQTCKLKKDQNCTNNPDMCQIRTYCQHDACVCLPNLLTDADCSVPTSNSSGSRAEVAYADCDPSNSSSCGAAGSAWCHHTLRKCRCFEGFAVSSSLECKPAAGSRCLEKPVGSDDMFETCAKGLICDSDSICRILVPRSCLSDKDKWCQIGAVCDLDGKCKLILNERCDNGHENHCQAGLVCDPFGKCSRSVGALCADRRDCVSGGVCIQDLSNNSVCECDLLNTKQDGGVCKPNPGVIGGGCSAGACQDSNSECNSGICVCDSAFLVDTNDFTCKAKEASPCSSSNPCAPGTVCDEDDATNSKICKVAVGFYCNKTAQNPCARGAVCDVDGICRWDWGMKCSQGSDSDQCQIGLVCDFLGVCKKSKGSYCDPHNVRVDMTGESECYAGTLCLDYRCVCNLVASEPKTTWCAPLAGRVGGSCKVGNTCDVAGGVCNLTTLLCECHEAFKVNSVDLSCRVSASRENDKDDLVIITVVALLIFTLLTALVFLARWQVREGKKDAVAEQFARRRSSIRELERSASLSIGGKPGSIAETPSSVALSSRVSSVTSASSVTLSTSSYASSMESELESNV